MMIKLDAKAIVTIVSALIAAGIWLGALQNRVTQLERHQRYEHGSYAVPNGE